MGPEWWFKGDGGGGRTGRRELDGARARAGHGMTGFAACQRLQQARMGLRAGSKGHQVAPMGCLGRGSFVGGGDRMVAGNRTWVGCRGARRAAMERMGEKVRAVSRAVVAWETTWPLGEKGGSRVVPRILWKAVIEVGVEAAEDRVASVRISVV